MDNLSPQPFEAPGGYLEARSGGRFWCTANPVLEDINAPDIAVSLANQCRFQGHLLHFYSVAEHSTLMAQYALDHLADPVLAWDCLWHDAPEAFIGDIPTPLKAHMIIHGMPVSEYEHLIWRQLAEFFNLPAKLAPEVHELDLRILLDERKALTSIRGQRANLWPMLDGLEPLGVKIEALEPTLASTRWLDMKRKIEGLRRARNDA